MDRSRLPGSRVGRTLPLLPVLLWAAGPGEASAQQFVTDDAALADPGSCEVEAWVGEEEAWLLPICHLIPGVELTAGALYADLGAGSRHPAAVLEAKATFGDAEAEGWSWGVVLGAAVPTDSELPRPAEVYAYVPVTWAVDALPVLTHVNVGWAMAREGDGDEDVTSSEHFVLWGTKGELGITGRISLVGELFGLAGEETQFQAGLRAEVIPDRLALDVSHAVALDAGDDGLGFQVGMAWTPPAIR